MSVRRKPHSPHAAIELDGRPGHLLGWTGPGDGDTGGGRSALHRIDLPRARGLRGLAAAAGAASTAALLRHRHRMGPSAAKALEKLAYATRRVFPVLAAGQRAGLVSAEQARAIVAGLDSLPATSTEADREWAQGRLVAQCTACEPTQLLAAAGKIVDDLTVVSADGPEPADPAVPDPQDRRALRVTPGGGGVDVRGFFPGLDGAWLAALLGARAGFDDEQHGDPAYGGKDVRTTDARNYDAIIAALRHAAGCEHDPAPVVPQLIITVDLVDLVDGLTGGCSSTSTSTWPRPTSGRPPATPT